MKISELDSYTKEDLDEAMECLIEANQIMKNPELLKLVQAHGKEMKDGITSVEQLRSTANKMFMQPSKEDAPEEQKTKSKKGAKKDKPISSVEELRAMAKESGQE